MCADIQLEKVNKAVRWKRPLQVERALGLSLARRFRVQDFVCFEMALYKRATCVKRSWARSMSSPASTADALFSLWHIQLDVTKVLRTPRQEN